MESFDLVYWDHSYNKALLINLAIAVGFFTSIRLFSGVISHVNSSKELFEKDNPAFGISMSGVAFAVTIMITGAIYGDPVNNLMDSVIAVGLYGLLGIIFLACSRIIFDKIALPAISLRDEIVKGNIAVGIVDASNVIATAIIIRAIMVWVENNTFESIQAVLIAFIISQVFLTLSTYLRMKVFANKNDGKCVQDDLRKGNVAVALRFAGRKIGTAFAITAASNLMVYEVYDLKLLVGAWSAVSILMVIILTALAFVADKIILFGIDINQELVKRKNVALGALQFSVYVSLGLLLSELMA